MDQRDEPLPPQSGQDRGQQCRVTVAAGGVVGATATFTCLAVFFRSAGMSLPWPEEISGNMLVWTCFLGAYLGVREDKHIAFDLLFDKFPPRMKTIVGIAGDLIVIGFFSVLVFESVRMLAVVGGTPLQSLDLPTGLFMAALPICGTAIVIALLLHMIERIRS